MQAVGTVIPNTGPAWDPRPLQSLQLAVLMQFVLVNSALMIC